VRVQLAATSTLEYKDAAGCPLETLVSLGVLAMIKELPNPMLDAIQNICDHLVERAATLFLGAGAAASLQS